MINEKFENILTGKPQLLSSEQVIEFGVHCAGQSLSLDNLLNISITLFKKSKENCFEFLQFIEKHQINRNNYRDFMHQPYKIKIYNNLAALTLSKALRESEKEGMQKLTNDSRKYLNSSEKVKNTLQKSIILLRGFLLYYDGDFGKASNIFMKAYDDLTTENEVQLPISALIGLAQINFIRKNYVKSLEFYKKALMANKSLSVNARLGMGYCFYELQKFELAELCFKRILKLDPTCAPAYMGLAVLRYKDEDFQGYFQNLQRAYDLDKQDPCVLLHMSEHFFFIGERAKSLKVCQRGLNAIDKMPKFIKCDNTIRNDYQQLRARFNNLIAQIHHINGQFDVAMKYYLQAKSKGLNFNEVGLAQVYIQANMLKQALNILQAVFSNISTKDSKLIGDAFKTLAYLQTKIGKYSLNGPNFYYKQALKFNKNDYEACIDYSVYLSETNNKDKTLKILQQAEKILNQNIVETNPELLNNIGVYLMETHQLDQTLKYLLQSANILEHLPKQTPSEQLRYQSLYLVCNFNLAIALQKMNMFSQAVEKHSQLISKNKYYMDSYSRLALIHFKHLGNRKRALQLLNEAIEIGNELSSNNTSSKIVDMLRLDKIQTLRAHFLHLDNSNGEAKQIFRKMGKKKFTYENLYELCLGYETIMKKNMDFSVIKDFLRHHRDYIIEICQRQHSNLYSYMIFTILLLIDSRISKDQAVKFFNQLKVAQIQFPQVLLNFGIFLVIHGDYENALFSLNRYKQKVQYPKVDQFITLAQFLSGNYEQCLKNLKRNILNEPNNLKLRFQYAYVIEKWIQKLYEEENNFKHLKETQFNLTMCRQIYTALAKTQPAEYLKQIDNPDMKQKIKMEISKIRSLSEDRKRFVHSQLEFYGKKKGQIIEKQKKVKDQEERRLEDLEKAKKTQELLDKIEGQMDVQDEEREKAIRKRQKLIDMSKQQSQIFVKAWEEEVEKQKQINDTNKARKQSRKEGGERRPRRTENLQKVSEDYLSDESSFDNNPALSQRSQKNEISQSNEKKRKHKDKSKKSKKHKRQKKKKKRHSSGQSEKEEGSEKSEKDEEEEQGSGNESGFERQKPQKKRKVQEKQEEEDDLGIDFGEYLLKDQ